MTRKSIIIPLNIKLFIIVVGVLIGTTINAVLSQYVDKYLYNQSSIYEQAYWQEFKNLQIPNTVNIESLNPLQYHIFNVVPYFNVRLSGTDISSVKQMILNAGWQEKDGRFIKIIDGKIYTIEIFEDNNDIEFNIYCIH